MSTASVEPTRPQPTMSTLTAWIVVTARLAVTGAGYDRLRRMRFPFTFMALLSLVVAAWIVVYLAGAHLSDPFARGIALLAVAIFAGLAAYQLYRVVTKGREA